MATLLDDKQLHNGDELGGESHQEFNREFNRRFDQAYDRWEKRVLLKLFSAIAGVTAIVFLLQATEPIRTFFIDNPWVLVGMLASISVSLAIFGATRK